MPDENHMSLIRTTYGSEDEARKEARRLVTKKQACCVHLQRIESVYVWKGEVEETGEWLLEARVPAKMAEDTWAALMKSHSYDVPLVELFAETRVNGKYAQWAHEVTRTD